MENKKYIIEKNVLFVKLETIDPTIVGHKHSFKILLEILNECNKIINEENYDMFYVVTEEKNINNIKAISLFDYTEINDFNLPFFWFKFNFTPKVDTIEKILINKNNFKSETEFVDIFFNWIKENCYDSTINIDMESGEKNTLEFRPKENYKGCFAITI